MNKSVEISSATF